jgi:hypothetical protein
MITREAKAKLKIAANALEAASDALGPDPLMIPVINEKPACEKAWFKRSGRMAKGPVPVIPTVGDPGCRPTPFDWIQELQRTLLETAAWVRYVADPPKARRPARRRRPKAKRRAKRARPRARA